MSPSCSCSSPSATPSPEGVDGTRPSDDSTDIAEALREPALRPSAACGADAAETGAGSVSSSSGSSTSGASLSSSASGSSAASRSSDSATSSATSSSSSSSSAAGSLAPPCSRRARSGGRDTHRTPTAERGVRAAQPSKAAAVMTRVAPRMPNAPK
eukprot:scaffold27966_cov64-Phaeocystis_antarctica.AAC.13